MDNNVIYLVHLCCRDFHSFSHLKYHNWIIEKYTIKTKNANNGNKNSCDVFNLKIKSILTIDSHPAVFILTWATELLRSTYKDVGAAAWKFAVIGKADMVIDRYAYT